LKLKFDLN